MNFLVVAPNTAKAQSSEPPATSEGILDSTWRGRNGIKVTDAKWTAMTIKNWGHKQGMASLIWLAELKPGLRKGHALIAAGEIHVGLTVCDAKPESPKRKSGPVDWAKTQTIAPRGCKVSVSA